ncbi:kunitz-type protease inhibitor 2 isoform X2 [Sparus aurata]|uniref:Kunitz-type serine protease inhibitor 6-like n=1 Tax=Sparus aurata TaxID=8175 RepID=A0A671TGB4_SPAAU|nr:kunitz-type protease inhibitor 1-like isoform X2 [Sparus aurata]
MMKMKRVRSSLVALCLLVCSGLALDCELDQVSDHGLNMIFLESGRLTKKNVSDPEGCKAACCDQPDCDLALVGHPSDGGPQCFLVDCRHRNVCVLQENKQFSVYRKKGNGEAGGEATEGGERVHIAPLLDLKEEPKDEESNNIRCRLPPKVGSCRASFPKFFYNVTNQSCQKFVYGGCEGNDNKFDSQDECETVCSGVSGPVLPVDSTPPPRIPVKAARMVPAFSTDVSQDDEAPVDSEPAATEIVQVQEKEMSAEDFAEHCGAEPEVGPCRASFQRWYHDRKTGSCQSFIYGGCNGNKNNFDSKESCVAACTVLVLPSSKKSDVKDSTEHKGHCVGTPDPGPCRAAFTMFYYDASTSTCQSFIYGGCRGNNNRYSSLEECMASCGPSTGSIDLRFERSEGLFLFVALGTVSALMLLALIIIVLRRRGRSRRPSSISDKEELLPEPDEQTSVESMSVPDSPKPDKA